MKPIIMTGNHPKLILDGTKTMTRRVVKPQPTEWRISQDIIGLSWKGRNLGSLSRDHRGSIAENYLATLCPYGQVGDKMWVKETWANSEVMDYVYFKADGGLPSNLKWQPSIHMFRKDSRITLEITEVRVERVQEITTEDAIAEGIDIGSIAPPEMSFSVLWDSLNAKRGYGWEVNPFCWVISFKKEMPDG